MLAVHSGITRQGLETEVLTVYQRVYGPFSATFSPFTFMPSLQERVVNFIL